MTAIGSVGAAALSSLLPRDYSASAIGLLFLGMTWLLVLREDDALVQTRGLSLGGILERAPIDVRRVAREAFWASVWALGLALLLFPPFWLGYVFWWKPTHAFHFMLPRAPVDEALGQWLVIAFPEEAFFRGYLMSELEEREGRKVNIFGVPLGAGWLMSAALFAVGHVLTVPSPARLAVFFPALLFGWLRKRTGGIGASVTFHALCNLFSATLARSYGIGP